MSRFARFYIFAGLLTILLLFAALALSAYFWRWPIDMSSSFKVTEFQAK